LWTASAGLLLVTAALLAPAPIKAALPGGEALWSAPPPRQPAVDLYFFWSSGCPHCLRARPFVESLPERHPWIRVHSLELLAHPRNRARFAELAAVVGIVPTSVPTFLWCGTHYTGFGSEATTGRFLVESLRDCHREVYGRAPPPAAAQAGTGSAEVADAGRVEVPWGGASFDAASYSLPVLAVVLGGLDAFNPCAFFVLLFLLSLLVNTRSRGRMLLVGSLFVVVSGLVYFAFMAAWLNLFQLLGAIRSVTLVAGGVALAIGLVNIKDYFRLGQGVSLSLSERHKERLLGRIRGLLGRNELPSLLLGTLTLAFAANTYELLCTMGLPMVFTRLLTLAELGPLEYYAYLALYNLVYVLPLAVIVGLFVATMGRRKLSEREGRFLKLLSGTMMLALGGVLLVSPERLSDPLLAMVLIGTAALLALVLHRLWQDRAPKPR
jgi:hypothetical protein